MRDSFVFYRSFYESTRELNDEQRLAFYEAIFELALNDEELATDGMVYCMVNLIKPMIIANNKRYTNGSKGGRPTTKKEEKEPQIAKKRAFQKPTQEEVEAFCEENDISIDTRQFIDYYDSNGWKVGKNAMKDWKATVRNWERRNPKPKKEKKIVIPEAEGEREELMRKIGEQI